MSLTMLSKWKIAMKSQKMSYVTINSCQPKPVTMSCHVSLVFNFLLLAFIKILEEQNVLKNVPKGTLLYSCYIAFLPFFHSCLPSLFSLLFLLTFLAPKELYT